MDCLLSSPMSQLDAKNGVGSHEVNAPHNYQLTINDVNPWHLESAPSSSSPAHQNRKETKKKTTTTKESRIRCYSRLCVSAIESVE